MFATAAIFSMAMACMFSAVAMFAAAGMFALVFSMKACLLQLTRAIARVDLPEPHVPPTSMNVKRLRVETAGLARTPRAPTTAAAPAALQVGLQLCEVGSCVLRVPPIGGKVSRLI